MAYDIKLQLPEGWNKVCETYEDESGAIITHLNASCPDAGRKRDVGMIDIYVGDMPEDTTAEDQALSNYADIVGFDENDPEDFNPVDCIKFNGKNAYGFTACCEDDSPMMFLSQEVRHGVLAIICAAAIDFNMLQDDMQLIERGLRIK